MLDSFNNLSRELKRRAHRIALIYFCALAFVGAGADAADRPSATEYAIKAAIIFKIAKFVAWPSDSFASDQAPMAICLVPNDPMESALDALSGKIIHGRSIAVRRINSVATDTLNCQVIVLGDDEGKDLLNHVENKPILTIGHSEMAGDKGEIIHLATQDNRIKFSIDVAASDRAGLNISAQLLQLAAVKDPEGSRR